nr:MAG TPA: hypothetical protein [Caudoviricetes sp.]
MLKANTSLRRQFIMSPRSKRKRVGYIEIPLYRQQFVKQICNIYLNTITHV